MVHLHVRSWFSFLAGGSPPQSLVHEAARLGQRAIAITDLHGVYGAVRFADACKAYGVKAIFGATLMVRPPAGPWPASPPRPLVLLAQNHAGYARLCELLTHAHQASPLAPGELRDDRLTTHPDQPVLPFERLQEGADNLICLTGGPESFLDSLAASTDQAPVWLDLLRPIFPQRLYVELCHWLRPGDNTRVRRLAELAAACGVPIVATNAVRYATPDDFPRYDALNCVRLGISVEERHVERPVNDAAYIVSEAELRGRIPYPQAFEATEVIAGQCDMTLLAEEVTPPSAQLPPGQDAPGWLLALCEKGLETRYPTEPRQAEAVAQMTHELAVVNGLDLAEFFLVVHEVVAYARSQGIRCAGRGSAANSIIAYLLGITEVDPIEHKLLFERFLHRGRKGMPDIDVDFDSERRNEVIFWMEQRFGTSHAAMTANVNTYRVRGAVREMMKVLGWNLEQVGDLTRFFTPWDGPRQLEERKQEFESVLGRSPLVDVLFRLVVELLDCPRHLSLHNGGMVLSRPPLANFTPIQISANGVRQVQFDKEDVERLGLIKFDILGLRTLAVLSEALKLQEADTGEKIDIDSLPMDDEKTFELIRSGETMSLFQIESPGQWNLLSRVQPRCFDDLIVEIALFRPGPLQGGMVNPYIERRNNGGQAEYLHPSLIPALRNTLGIILFQDQVLEVSHDFAGLTLEEADKFRSLMSKWRDPGKMEDMREKFVQGAMRKHGVSRELADEVFRQVAAFVGYGFCRSHAAAFARTVYHTAWLKTHYPAAYMAAVLQQQPGFYPMNTVLEEAKTMKVRILPVDAWKSGVRYQLEGGAIRLPLTQVLGVTAEVAGQIVLHRDQCPTLLSLRQHVAIPADAWEALARAGAFDRAMERRQALWQVGIPLSCTPIAREQLTLFPEDIDAALVPYLEKLCEDYLVAWDLETMSLTPRMHPVGLHRAALAALGVQTLRSIRQAPDGARLRVAGLVIVSQRPPTAKGMRFMVLEDETGRMPLAIAPPTYDQNPRSFRHGLLVVEGRVQEAGPTYKSMLAERGWGLMELVGPAREELQAAVVAKGRGTRPPRSRAS